MRMLLTIISFQLCMCVSTYEFAQSMPISKTFTQIVSIFYACPTGPEPEAQCFGKCGVYIENGPPIRVLSGIGLFVEDADHNEIFFMKVRLQNMT